MEEHLSELLFVYGPLGIFFALVLRGTWIGLRFLGLNLLCREPDRLGVVWVLVYRVNAFLDKLENSITVQQRQCAAHFSNNRQTVELLEDSDEKLEKIADVVGGKCCSKLRQRWTSSRKTFSRSYGESC